MKKIHLFKSALFVALLIPLGLSACSSSSSDKPAAPAPPEVPVEDGEVTVYLTSADRSAEFKKQAVSFDSQTNLSPNTLYLDPAKRFQQMDGFGAAITGSTCYNLMQMNPADRKAFLTETFSTTEGMGQSYIRISIGASDFSLSEYTLWDTPGKENFALQEEEIKYVIPVLKEILAINPNVLIMGSPWSPPRWMKVEDLQSLKPYLSWTSGQLNPEYYQDYGWYFVQWIKTFENEGIPIYSITPQNEPLNRGNSMSLFMGWEEQRDFIKQSLGPQIQAAGLKTKIYAFDHNYNYDNMADQQGFPLKIYQDPEAAAYLAGAAFHNYGGDKAELLRVHEQRPDKELVFTETSIGTWNDGRNLSKRLMEDMEQVGLGTVNNWSKGVIVWNLMLDSELGPNRDGGCQTCYGAVDIEKSNYKTIVKNSHYFVVGHFSAVVQPGATRIATRGFSEPGITSAAFENPDGSYAVVLLNNTGNKKNLVLNDGKNSFQYEVPARAVVSYKWKP